MNLDIKTKCKECSSKNFEFIERLGEQACVDCGLILSVNPLEETVSYSNTSVSEIVRNPADLGSHIWSSEVKSTKHFALKKQHTRSNNISESDRLMTTLCNMILSNYNVSTELKNITMSYYTTLKKERVFRGVKIEWRAAALTYYVLKENNIVTDLITHEKISKVSKSDISRQAKKVAKFRRNSQVFTVRNPITLANTLLDRLENPSSELRLGVIQMVEYISRNVEQRDVRFTDNMLAACFYMASKMLSVTITQRQLEENWPCSSVGIRTTLTTLSKMFNFDRSKISGYDLDSFTMGVRY